MQRARLVAAFLAFGALCIGVSTLSAWRDRIATLEQARREVTATARLLDEHASRAIEASDVALQSFIDTLEPWDLKDPDMGRRLWNTLRERVRAIPQVGAAWVVDAWGTAVLGTWEFPTPPHNYAHRDYFKAHQDASRVLFLEPSAPGSRTQKDRFTISRAFRDGEGRVRGVAVVAIHSDHFSNLYGQTGWGNGSRLALYTAGKERLAQWPPEESAPPPAAVWPAPGQAEASPAVIDDTHVTAARRLEGYPVVVVASRPLDEILAGWRERTVWTAVYAACVLAGAALLFLNALNGIRREASMRAELVRNNQSLDERVRQRTAELESALRTAEMANLAKMKVLATVSHDLRQPLQGLAAFHDLLLKQSASPDLHRLGAMASASLQAGQRLLDDLLALSRLEAGVVPVEESAFALGPVLDQLAAEVRAEAEAKRLRLTVMPTSAWVRSDPARLQQILRNLLSNAVKYTERGGVVVGVRRRGDQARIEVWDSGQGIPAVELGTIWEEFYQIGNPARDGSRGAGLGLSIVERTARLMGHRLDVRSRVGRGSVFAVTLPRIATRAAPIAPPVPTTGRTAAGRKDSRQEGRLRGRLVLVVEDDPLQRNSLTLVLEQAGARVVAVETFNAALAAARAALQPPSAILSDYRLPGGTDGLSGIQELRATLGVELPAVLLTGELSSDLARAAKAAGCALLTKPASPDSILTTLAEMTKAAEAA
ncbi:ATP-binding protein [Azospirillum soli]|uniref:ATP-binding protein n=1 Tax=Azospirillum soli TaxID=1304799 RepID=UPI001AE4FD13|nr:ATP-binding protein [Azospirillum soli]MBP2313050.1 signal transduction histidine kinase/ActR/RegA family two-component response regulator [Azospirillum soli]